MAPGGDEVPQDPPWPPTSAVSPSGGSCTTSRMSPTAASTSSPSDETTGTTIWAAVPSVEYDGSPTCALSTFST